MLLTIRKYVTWNFLLTLCFCTVLILGLTVMLDFVQRTDDFSQLISSTDHTWAFVASFYLPRLPMFLTWLFPIILLTANGVSLIGMNRNNELVPLLMAGISIHQILLPMYLFFIAGGIGVFCVQEWILPSSAGNIARSKQLLESGNSLENVLAVDNHESYVQSQSFNPSSKVLKGVTLMKFENNILKKIVRAEQARWNRSANTWVFEDGRVTPYDKEGFRAAPPQSFKENGYAWKTSLTPHQLLTQDAEIKFHTLSELYDMIDKWPHLLTLRMTVQTRLVYPFITMLLPLFAIPVLLRREITSYFVGGVFIAGIAIGFYLFQIFFTKFGASGILHPIIASWTPVLSGTCLLIYFQDRILT